MKKLSKLKLHNAIVLNNGEMKNVVGGAIAPQAICIALCHGKESVGIECTGTCSARDYMGVTCSSADGTLQTERCPEVKS